MEAEKNTIYEFGNYRLNPAERLLLRDGEVVNLPPKAFETLVFLVKHGGHLVRRKDLIQALWTDSFVEEANLTVHISTLRKTLNAVGADEFIETVKRGGYRFVAPVREFTPDTLVIEKTTHSQIIIEEETEDGEIKYKKQLPAPVRRQFVRILIVLCVVLTIGTTWLVFVRQPPSTAPNNKFQVGLSHKNK